jgi:hypothetical protein
MSKEKRLFTYSHSANKLEEYKTLIEDLHLFVMGMSEELLLRASLKSFAHHISSVFIVSVVESIDPAHFNRYDFSDIAVRVLGDLIYHEVSNHVASKQTLRLYEQKNKNSSRWPARL